MDTFSCKWYFWAEGHCPLLSASAVCLQTKGKECQFCFASLEVSFFPSAVTAAPNLSPLLFSRTHPLLLHLIGPRSLSIAVVMWKWCDMLAVVGTVSPLNLISFGRDCWSSRQQMLITLHLHMYFCSAANVCKRGPLRVRMVKSKPPGTWRIQSSAGLEQETSPHWR